MCTPNCLEEGFVPFKTSSSSTTSLIHWLCLRAWRWCLHSGTFPFSSLLCGCKNIQLFILTTLYVSQHPSLKQSTILYKHINSPIPFSLPNCRMFRLLAGSQITATGLALGAQLPHGGRLPHLFLYALYPCRRHGRVHTANLITLSLECL